MTGWWRRWGQVLGQFFYGLTIHELNVETRHARAELHNLFMLAVFGDLIGLPILPPYYSLRLLPHIVADLERWKKSILREKDLTDLARYDI